MKILLIKFSNRITLNEIPQFRGAIIDANKEKNELFHNHHNNSFRYSYPLIQYKRIENKAALLFVNEAVTCGNDIILSDNFHYRFGDKSIELKIESVNLDDYDISIDGNPSYYKIQNWLPLNSLNYQLFQSNENLIEKIGKLETILTANILSMLKGIGIFIDTQIVVSITNLSEPKIISYKGVKMMAFDADFKTNISLPSFIGLGKSVSVGFGTIRKITKNS